MNANKNNPPADTSDREIVISRVFAAPREMVWRAMTDPKQVVLWWGPVGFTTTIKEMDFRVGGVWKHTMRGPDGTNYPNHSTFTEIVEPERIVYQHGGCREGGPGVSFEATWTFEVVDQGHTRVTIRQLHPTTAQRDFLIKEFGAVEGGKQTLARLDEHLAKSALVTDCDFIISRTFDAPRELVWRAWTEPKNMQQWWGPHQFTNNVCEMDLRGGGAHRIVMRSPDGAEYAGKGFFREIIKPERLVMTMDHSELPAEWHDQVNPTRDKSQKPALESIMTITFEDIGGKTKLTVRCRFESMALRDSMLKIGMNGGWSQSLERLTTLLPKM